MMVDLAKPTKTQRRSRIVKGKKENDEKKTGIDETRMLFVGGSAHTWVKLD